MKFHINPNQCRGSNGTSMYPANFTFHTEVEGGYTIVAPHSNKV